MGRAPGDRGVIMPSMALTRGLIWLSAAVFAITGMAYVFAPGVALSIVGIDGTATTSFLLRTEGVLFLAGAGVVATVAARPTRFAWVALATLGGYYVVSSLVDLQAYSEGVVGPASIPSAAVRIALGAVCLVAAVRERQRGEP